MKLFTEYFSIDLGTNGIKIFSVNPGDGGLGYVVADAIHQTLPQGLISGGFTNPVIRSIPELANELKRALNSLSSQKEGCILGLPDRWVKLHLVDIVLKPNEMSSPDYLSWRLRKMLNLPEGIDISIDHQILSVQQAEDGFACKIMVGAVRRDLLITISTLLADLSVELMAIDTSTLGVYNLLEERHPEKTIDQNLIMCHIGHETTVTKFFHSGSLVYERVIEVAGEEFTRLLAESEQIDTTNAEAIKTSRKFFPLTNEEILDAVNKQESLRKIFGNWLRELSVTFRFYQDKFKVMRLPKIYLTGGSSLFAGLPEFLGDFFDTSCERYNPLVDMPTTKSIDKKLLSMGPLFAPSVGLLSN